MLFLKESCEQGEAITEEERLLRTEFAANYLIVLAAQGRVTLNSLPLYN